MLLRSGRVVAVKGLGGYHLAAAADHETAVAALRARKHREDKPFAVMVPDVAAARRLADLDAGRGGGARQRRGGRSSCCAAAPMLRSPAPSRRATARSA